MCINACQFKIRWFCTLWWFCAMPTPVRHGGKLIIKCLHAGDIKAVCKMPISYLCRAGGLRIFQFQVVTGNYGFPINCAVWHFLSLRFRTAKDQQQKNTAKKNAVCQMDMYIHINKFLE